MRDLAANRRFEEAASTRDRAQALAGALRRQRQIDEVRAAGIVHLSLDSTDFVVDHGRLIAAAAHGQLCIELPLPAPEMADLARPLGRHLVDEVLCIARHL
jgi:excinuclease UvrABC nuclease subunit